MIKRTEIFKYSDREEFLHSITHGLGIFLSIAGLVTLVLMSYWQGDLWRVLSFSIYGLSLIALYTASTLYHSFKSVRLKHYFKIFDHSAIYILIAGTYTPFTLVLLKGQVGWTMFIIIWSIAITGVLFKLFFVHRFKIVSTILYLGMGWVGLLALTPLFESLPFGGLFLLGAGGFAYSFGVIFYLWNKLPYNHAIWHIFVLGGSICHFLSVLLYVLPQ